MRLSGREGEGFGARPSSVSPLKVFIAAVMSAEVGWSAVTFAERLLERDRRGPHVGRGLLEVAFSTLGAYFFMTECERFVAGVLVSCTGTSRSLAIATLMFGSFSHEFCEIWPSPEIHVGRISLPGAVARQVRERRRAFDADAVVPLCLNVTQAAV